MKTKYPTTPGQIFGFYEVVATCGAKSYCRCRCGTERWIHNKNLCTRVNPKCRSCFAIRSKFPQRIVHVAYNAIDRCTNKKHKRYPDWGGRGIVVFRAWLSDINSFCSYMMSLSGACDDSLVLDRINNDGNYEPGNLRWVTRSQSQKNQRKCKPRSEAHLMNMSLARRGRPWTKNQRDAYLRRKNAVG